MAGILPEALLHAPADPFELYNRAHLLQEIVGQTEAVRACEKLLYRIDGLRHRWKSLCVDGQAQAPQALT